VRAPSGRTIHCYVCGKDIGLYGWPSHVAAEKRRYGADIYCRKRAERTNTKPPAPTKNRNLTDYTEGAP